MHDHDKVLGFWNGRAELLERAGTNDLIAKKLEIANVARHIGDGMRILEIGCGNGITAIELAKRYSVDIVAVDFSEEMIKAARRLLSGEALKGTVEFLVGDVRDLPDIQGAFDVVLTERVLINLPCWEAQAQAIRDISTFLSPGGRYLMCENSMDGLAAINEMREAIGLKSIQPPWHNQYFDEQKLLELDIPDFDLVRVESYSSTYYFLSRVLNAWFAAQEGKDPAYDAPINQLALALPSIGEFGQGKLWIWQKRK